MLLLKAEEDNGPMDEDDEGEDMSKFLSKLFDFLLKVSRWCIEKIINVVLLRFCGLDSKKKVLTSANFPFDNQV